MLEPEINMSGIYIKNYFLRLSNLIILFIFKTTFFLHFLHTDNFATSINESEDIDILF